MDIVEKYGITKSSIYEWSRKYGEECPNTTGNIESSVSSDYRKRKRIILNTIKNIYYDNNRIIGHRGMVIF